MSIYAMVWAYEQDVKNSGQKFTLVTAAQYANDQGICWAGQETLAEDMSMDRRSVLRHLQALEDAGLIERTERRRKDGSRATDMMKLVGFVKPTTKVTNRHADNVTKTTDQRDKLSGHETLVSKKRKNDKESSNESSLSGVAKNGERPMEMGQYAIKELMDRINAAREQGKTLHTPTNDERKSFAAMFKQCDKDGHEDDAMLFALDYMVAKAAGEIEGEPNAWCGFRTALDRVVVDGWRPDGAMTRNEEAQLREVQDFNAETMRMFREAMEGGQQ
jgi:DNA-binding MarR family transcriptional regulator